MSHKQPTLADQLERYCLGLLTHEEASAVERAASAQPAVRAQLDQMAQTLANYALANPATPSPGLKNRVLAALNGLGEGSAFDLQALPRINAFSDADQWQRTVAAIQPPATYRNLFGHVLRQEGGVEQFLLWVRACIRPEEHHDERESFLILEGRCECSIGGKLVQLGPGDYLAVPLDREHTVRVISEIPVKAILQRVKLAAY